MSKEQKLHVKRVELIPEDNERLANLCGQFDEHLKQIERRLAVDILGQGNTFQVSGERKSSRAGARLLEHLYRLTENEILDPKKVHLQLQDSGIEQLLEHQEEFDEIAVRTKRLVVRARGENQAFYVNKIRDNDISFGVGPAGTGKTFLAVACAVEALNHNQVQRLILVRPAVEAGEKLGFLPGDLAQKVDPYLRPLYDALYEMLGFDQVARLIEKNVIEIAPLAFMRGRTLNDAFIILDEAQNTTVEQMKMFLTRIGYGSTAVVTGDLTQVDLPKNMVSGLRDGLKVLREVEGVSQTWFTVKDVVRHPVVQRIVSAYEKADARNIENEPQYD